MQEAQLESRKAQSNRARTQATRAALILAARDLFAAKGYAETGTPEIVTAAGVTRGALYHHFVDKLALFRAVIEAEAEAVARQIASDESRPESALEAMLRGGDLYFDAMAQAGRAKLLLLEGPAVLGVAAMEEIDRRTGQRELRDGLAFAVANTETEVPLDALATILSAAFDKAALAIVLGEPVEDYKEAIRVLAEGIPGMKPV